MPSKPLVSVGGRGQLLVLGVKSSRGFTPERRFLKGFGFQWGGGGGSCSVVHVLAFKPFGPSQPTTPCSGFLSFHTADVYSVGL